MTVVLVVLVLALLLCGRALVVARTGQAAAERELAVLRGGGVAQQVEAASARVLREHLDAVGEQLLRLERDRSQAQGSLRTHLEAVAGELGRLRTETGALVSALKRPQVRGAWGELQLRNVVRIAGMTDRVDFHEQRTLADGLRPDMTVHLPTGRDVVVDAKVPLDAYLAALEAPDGPARDAELARHARQVRAHLDALAGKAYHARLERSAEFVVCFIPNEACYVAALDVDPSLLEHGAARGVLIATPTTLLALLHATHYGWRQAEVEASALEIAAAGRELHKRCATFVDAFARVGTRLQSATTAYNEAVGSLDARVLPQLRRLEEHGARSEKPITAVAPVEAVPRPLAREAAA